MTPIPAATCAEMIEQAAVDCYDDSERACGWFTMLDEALALPFETSILGVPVIVTALKLTVDDQIVAVCVRPGFTQRIRVLDLSVPRPAPGGADWILAYRQWSKLTGGV